jgi:hypothetical protein
MSLSPVESKTDVLLESLRKFYAIPANLRILTDVLRNKTSISLRTLDWLCTNYAKKKNIVYVLQPSGKSINVYMEYKSCLKAFSKRAFDPFQRRDRISIMDADGQDMTSTAGQLNFFRFAIQSGVIQYTMQHAAVIEADMLRAIKQRHDTSTKNRKELSRSALKSATATNIQVTVRFT